MPYRRTDRIEQRLADKRQRILRAARQLVADGGFQIARIATVAELAGVATGTVYCYFPSKADLLAQVVASVSEHELGVLRAITSGEGGYREKLVAAVRCFCARALRGRTLAYAMIAEPVDREVDVVRLRYRRAVAELFECLLRDGIAAQAFPPQNAAASAACTVGGFMEALIGPLAPAAEAIAEDEATFLDQLATFCLRGVVGSDRREAA